VAIKGELFELEGETGDFTFYFDVVAGDVENRSIYFTRNNKFHFSQSVFLLGVISFVGGTFEEGIFDVIYQAKKSAGETYAGYTQEPEDDAPFEFSTTFNSQLGLEAHHHIVRDTGCRFAMGITLLNGFVDSDIEEVLQTLSRFRFTSPTEVAPFGELLQVRISSETNQFKVGNRILLSSSDLAS
jgi:hypothetical protein